jgi:tRNA (guanine-N7-)-methyltransferase
MKKRCRQHVNPLKVSSLASRPAPLALPGAKCIEVELGCGDAAFLLQLAALHPEKLFFGLDIRGPFLDAAAQEISRLKLTNVALVPTNLIIDSSALFPVEGIDRFYINFPDPWFKRRHHNRRWLKRESLCHIVRALKRQGEIFFQSDVWSLAIEALALFEESPSLKNSCGEWTFLRQNPFLVRSSRESACLERNAKIWRLLFSRER